MLLHDGLAGTEELVPEQRLERIKVNTAVTEEVYRHPGSLQVLLIDTVHDEHIILRQLNASSLDEAESHELQTDHVVTFHLQVARQRQFLRTHLYREFHL